MVMMLSMSLYTYNTAVVLNKLYTRNRNKNRIPARSQRLAFDVVEGDSQVKANVALLKARLTSISEYYSCY